MPRLTRLLLGLATCLLVVTSCGIPTENSVRPIAIEDVPDQLKPIPETTVPASIPEPSVTVQIYFYRTDPTGEVIDLVPVDRQVESATPEAALRALLSAEPTEEEEGEGLLSLLGGATTEEPIELIGVEDDGAQKLIIDLSGLPAIEGELAAVPWGQMVFTATQDFADLEFRRVRFEVRGEQVPSLTQEESAGQGRFIRRNQFLNYDPTQRTTVTIPGSTAPPSTLLLDEN